MATDCVIKSYIEKKSKIPNSVLSKLHEDFLLDNICYRNLKRRSQTSTQIKREFANASFIILTTNSIVLEMLIREVSIF